MNRRTLVRSAVIAAAVVSAGSALAAQGAPPATEVGAAQLALVIVPANGTAKLSVTSPAFKSMGDIPFENTQYRGNVFPGLSWTGGPANTKSYVVILQDGDALMRNAPILHWTMFNVPPKVTRLDAAMTAPPAGAMNGPNMRGANQAFLGPHTPPGPKHRYHFQVFALDALLTLDPGATYANLVDAMKGHVVATGELIGLGQAAPPQ